MASTGTSWSAAVIARRLGLLPEATRRLLAVCAVAGGSVDGPLLARAGGVGRLQLPAQLEPAVAAGLVAVGDDADEAAAIHFTDQRICALVSAGLDPFRRQQLHLLLAQAAAALPDRPPDERARHLHAAGDLAPLARH